MSNFDIMLEKICKKRPQNDEKRTKNDKKRTCRNDRFCTFYLFRLKILQNLIKANLNIAQF